MNEFKVNFRNLLLNNRFRPLQMSKISNLKNYYVRDENPILYIVGVFEKENFLMEQEFLWSYAESLSEDERLLFTEIIVVSVYLGEKTDDFEEYSFLNEHLHVVQWFYNFKDGTLETFPNQPNKLLGIEKLLSKAKSGEEIKVSTLKFTKKHAPIMSLSIFILWVLVLISIRFDILFNNGVLIDIYKDYGLSRGGILDGKYYQFLTSAFIHDGLMHLLSNMIYLYYFGGRLELLLGTFKFTIIYTLSVLSGGLLSILFNDSICIGASGGTYGLLGAMLMIAREYGNRYTSLNYSTLVTLSFVSLTAGFFALDVSNLAHFAGFFTGIIFGNILLKASSQNI